MVISSLGSLLNGEGIKSIDYDTFIKTNPLEMTQEEMMKFKQYYASLSLATKKAGLELSSKRNKALGVYKIFQ